MPASLDDLEADRLQGAEDPFEWRASRSWRVDREIRPLRRERGVVDEGLQDWRVVVQFEGAERLEMEG
ncbi:MAG: hypothetical protein DIJKHBIC_04262 [Thermoanaerobaculia bacterium]|nr:hypothetical protein [Thermoanaerobaculia bacterium]